MQLQGLKNIWLDCDPGHDDIFALILALFNPKLRLLGISTVYGNSDVATVTDTTKKLLNTLGKFEVPIYSGSPLPLNPYRAQTKLKQQMAQPSYQPYKDLYDCMRSNIGSDQFTIIMTGPQTNIARLLLHHPQILSQVDEIIFMGGTSAFGNITPNAEFNVYSDAEAAYEILKICFMHHVKVVMVPLDVTHQVIADQSVMATLKEMQTPFSDWCFQLLTQFQEDNLTQEFDFPPLHDPVAVYYAIQPEEFQTQEVHCDIEIQSNLCYGRTTIDLKDQYKKDKNIHFCKSVKLDNFWDSIFDSIKSASNANTASQNMYGCL